MSNKHSKAIAREIKGMTVEDAQAYLDDVIAGRKFDDAIARSAYNVDIHNPHDDKSTWFEIEDAYDIPYRCLVPNKVDNLLVAGRCISTTHEASGSARMTPHVAATGEAAGTGAALAVREGTTPRSLDVGLLRETLRANNANLGTALEPA